MKPNVKENEKYQTLLRLIGDNDFYLEHFLKELIDDINNPTLEDIWIDEPVAVSYWLYIANNPFEQSEIDFIKNLLIWRELHGKSMAKVKCVHSSDNKNYQCCIQNLKVKSFPSLIITNSPDFEKHKVIDGSNLKSIKVNSPISFFNMIHSHILAGEDFESINFTFNAFYNEEKTNLNEVKVMISENKIVEALNWLKKNLTVYHSKYNDLTLFSSQLSQVENEKLKGIIADNEYNIIKSRLVNALINLIDGI